ncbi:MAG: redoxin domain-containing protein, partial [Alphaproteobacteria bacterium]
MNMPTVPDVTFKTRVRNDAIEGSNPFEWKDLTCDEIFKGKRIALFALPGAFTPTCSTSHLPRYEELHDELRAEGIDQIICLSVNDAFVMYQWG